VSKQTADWLCHSTSQQACQHCMSQSGKNLEWVYCDLCGADSAKSVYVVKGDQPFSFPEPLSYVKCKQCGLVYTNPRPCKEVTEEQYEEKYARTDLPIDSNNYLRKILENSVGRLAFIEKYKQGKELLDVGCCQGNFISVARLKGWNVLGVEVSKRYSTVAREQFKLPVMTNTIENAGLLPDSFDVVTSFDVIEHLPDPLNFLRQCKLLLRKDGILIAETCNYDALHQLVLGKRWQSDAGQHLYLFTPKTLREIAEKAGLKVIEINKRTGWEHIFSREVGEQWWHTICNVLFRMLSVILGKQSMIVLVATK